MAQMAELEQIHLLYVEGNVGAHFKPTSCFFKKKLENITSIGKTCIGTISIHIQGTLLNLNGSAILNF